VRTFKRGPLLIYSGCTAQIVGTAAKASSRFFFYENAKHAFAALNGGTLSSAGLIAAGLAAGAAEGALVVAPSEKLKTELIADANRPTRKFAGFIDAARQIIQADGLRGLYRGVVPVIARQGVNNGVRLSVYGVLKERAAHDYPDGKLPTYVTFLNGVVAGVCTVYASQPVDVVKTRMQSPDAQTLYNRSSLNCIRVTLQQDGILAFWRGATARLGRVGVSGAIVFTVYEKVLDMLQS
jgi:solute carrier family 25 citrate transporter 1